MGDRVNWDYLVQIKDFYLFLKALFLKENENQKRTGNILLVNPCLIGDFIVSLPAIRKFIKENKGCNVDLIVSPPLKGLASRIRGIKNVFVAKSSSNRKIEKNKVESAVNKKYDKIIIMRISPESYDLIKRISSKQIYSPLFKFIKYVLISPIRDSILKNKPTQRRDIDFELLNLAAEDIKFEEIFDFNKKDYDRIKKSDILKTKSKIIIIHTGPVWIMRKWDNNKWAELLKKINAFEKTRFIFIGTGEAEADYTEISNLLNFKVYSLINQLDTHDLMILLRLSNYLIGVDSGPRNMAHLADLRSITLFGPAASGAIYMPWDQKDVVIDKSKGGGAYEALFYKKNSFIRKITADEVFKAFKELAKKVKIKE